MRADVIHVIHTGPSYPIRAKLIASKHIEAITIGSVHPKADTIRGTCPYLILPAFLSEDDRCRQQEGGDNNNNSFHTQIGEQVVCHAVLTQKV